MKTNSFPGHAITTGILKVDVSDRFSIFLISKKIDIASQYKDVYITCKSPGEFEHWLSEANRKRVTQSKDVI